MATPLMTLRTWYRFESAHRLPNVPEGHKCNGLHGHSYKVEIAVTGNLHQSGEGKGMVIDKFDIDRIMAGAVAQVDHKILNEVGERPSHFRHLANPTAENIARYFYNAFPRRNFRCHRLEVTVWEGEELSATYWGSHEEWKAEITEA